MSFFWILSGLLATQLYSQAESPTATAKWKLLYEETFDANIPTQEIPWQRDPHGPKSPWHVDHIDDDGEYFRVNGGKDFLKQLNSFDIYRKRVVFGNDGWLTAEMAGRDSDKDGKPDQPPSLTKVQTGDGNYGAAIIEPNHHGGLLLRSTKPLPRRYRVEMTLLNINFGGSRYDLWESAAKLNGYDKAEIQTHHPWPWGDSKNFAQPYEQWPDVRDTNGFYYLAIVDYANPAPHNNIFIHTHRKVAIDSLNHPPPANDLACNPIKGEYYSGRDNAVTAFFLTRGRPIESKALMFSDCPGNAEGAAAAQLLPEILPQQPYVFSIERSSAGYALELSGHFRFVGQKTYRYHRDFIKEGVPIWHYNQTPQEYDGGFDEPWEFEGPYGKFKLKRSWPKGSAYPDYFIIGDPHLNFYEGSAVVDNIRLFVAN